MMIRDLRYLKSEIPNPKSEISNLSDPLLRRRSIRVGEATEKKRNETGKEEKRRGVEGREEKERKI